MIRGRDGLIPLILWSSTLFGDEMPRHLDLGKVQDKTFLEEADVPGYYGLLNRVRQEEPGQTAAAAQAFLQQRRPLSKKFGHLPADKFPLFADLVFEPEPYRGQPVTLKGHSQVIKRYAAEENPYGITTLYECSLFTDDSQSNPTTVIFTEAPADLPLGEGIVDGVVASGYFLKLHAYHARDEKTHFAPLILARTIIWKRDSVRSPWLSPSIQYMLYGGFAAVVVGWLFVRWNSRPPRRPLEGGAELTSIEIRE